MIGGEWGSRRLRAPAGRATRPSSDRLRQALFDVLGARVAGLPFLDGFAGSGAVGIEAYSRGARPVVWIEADRGAARTLRQNLESLELPRAAAVVLERSFAAGLRAAAHLAPVLAAGGFGVIFLDPPYAEAPRYPRLLTALAQPGLLRPEGWVILEARKGATLPAAAAAPAGTGLALVRQHAVGGSVLAFYRIAAS